eukprot:SAG31_NODE_1630_length_7699_cov_36.170921_4_plen_61_part_00
MRRTVVTQEDSEYGSQLIESIRIASVMILHAAGSSNDNPYLWTSRMGSRTSVNPESIFQV